MYNFSNNLIQLQETNAAWMDTYMRLKGLACTMFKWTGLPESCNARYLEEMLFFNGSACFFYHDSLGWLTLGCAASGQNVYGEPNRFVPISNGSGIVFRELTDENAVFIRNTFDCFPTVITTIRYTKAIYEIDSARDVNIKAQKTPILVLTSEKQKTTMENVYKKYIGNQPVIFGIKDTLDPKAVSVLKTDAPFVAGSLQDIKITIWNEYLNVLGVGQTKDDKPERLITGQLEETEKQVTALSNIMLAPRKEAANLMSKMCGNQIKVELRTDLEFASPNFNRNNSSVNYSYSAERNYDNGSNDN